MPFNKLNRFLHQKSVNLYDEESLSILEKLSSRLPTLAHKELIENQNVVFKGSETSDAKKLLSDENHTKYQALMAVAILLEQQLTEESYFELVQSIVEIEQTKPKSGAYAPFRSNSLEKAILAVYANQSAHNEETLLGMLVAAKLFDEEEFKRFQSVILNPAKLNISFMKRAQKLLLLEKPIGQDHFDVLLHINALRFDEKRRLGKNHYRSSEKYFNALLLLEEEEEARIDKKKEPLEVSDIYQDLLQALNSELGDTIYDLIRHHEDPPEEGPISSATDVAHEESSLFIEQLKSEQQLLHQAIRINIKQGNYPLVKEKLMPMFHLLRDIAGKHLENSLLEAGYVTMDSDDSSINELETMIEEYNENKESLYFKAPPSKAWGIKLAVIKIPGEQRKTALNFIQALISDPKWNTKGTTKIGKKGTPKGIKKIRNLLEKFENNEDIFEDVKEADKFSLLVNRINQVASDKSIAFTRSPEMNAVYKSIGKAKTLSEMVINLTTSEALEEMIDDNDSLKLDKSTEKISKLDL